jgi:hypothetical protein
MAKIVAFCYTQTGQGRDILQSVIAPVLELGDEVVIKEIVPERQFPLPWSSDSFFDAFPESRMGIGCGIKAMDLSDVEDARLVIVVYPVWFLSPAIPVHAFFQDASVRRFLDGKPVITVCGCRNMQVMAQRKIKSYINICNARLVGNICLQDRHHNLVSVITIIRWLLGGRKEKSGIFPAAGVSDRDIANAEVFGCVIALRLASGGDFDVLQDELMTVGAVIHKPHIAFIERTGHRIFGIWAKTILKHGKHRRILLKIFKYYLFAVIYLISPIGLAFYFMLYPFRRKQMTVEN